MEVERLRKRLDSVEWETEPYSYFYQTDVFSEHFYQSLLNNLPDISRYKQYGGYYKTRYLFDMRSDDFWKSVDGMFRSIYGMNSRIQLCRDLAGYSIGPHTDGRKDTKTVLFYLPKDDTNPILGTSVYVPKDSSFTCDGSEHHEPKLFDRVLTIPFVPNSCFGFIRSDNSFHGVEPSNAERNLIQVSIWR